MKLYKGFNKELQCTTKGKVFQYELGKTYEEKSADICNCGFHACENPLECFNHYAPGDGRYCVVELDGVTDQRRGDDTKRVGTKITIGAELSVRDLCRAHFEYTTERCSKVDGNVGGDNEAVAVQGNSSASVGDSGSASAGNSGSASAGVSGSASAGDWGSASAGNYGSASAGYSGSASAGDGGSASAGNSGSASAGENGSASAGYKGSASAGNYGSASAGVRGSASAGEDGSASAGENGIACCRSGKVKGKIGCAICVAETDDGGKNINIAAGIVDGKNLLPDVWYKAKDGKFVEVKDDEND